MRYVCLSTFLALGAFAPSAAFGQPQGLSIPGTSNSYQYVSEQRVTRTISNVTYSATLVNTGAAWASVTATLTSLDPAHIQVAPGQGVLSFAPVPANSQVPSGNTFSILVDRAAAFDYTQLQWSFQTVSLKPVANAGPNQLVKLNSMVTLNGGGSTNPSGAGTLTYSWALTSKPAGSNAILSNPAGVMPTFVADVVGTWNIALTVNNGTASNTAGVSVSTSTPPAPVANAGPNQTVNQGATVVLNGSGSTSGSGNPLTYAWTLTAPAGSTAVLTGANTVAPAFVADKPNATYTATLIVNDGIAGSAPSTVTSSTGVVAPVANAGANQVVNVNSAMQLNGAGSTDANGLPLTYQWSLITLPAGSAATLSSVTAVNPTFTPDRPGAYVAQLIVNNGKLGSAASTVTITTNQVQAPAANAGNSQTVNVGSMVTLNGGGTDPQNLPLTFKWTLINKPAGSSAVLSSAVLANPVFTADLAGPYVAQLIVNNGFLDSAASTVTINTTCSQPTANPGANQNVLIGATVKLDGSKSGDACNDPLTYSWTLTTAPAGSAATLSGATTASPSFVADLAGAYVAQLIVNNGFSKSNPATVTLAVSPITFSFSPGTLTIPNGATVNLTLNLVAGASAPAGGLTVNLSSDNTSVATVPSTLTFAANSTSLTVPVTGIAQGSAFLHASAANIADTTALLLVQVFGQIVTASGTVGLGQSSAFPVSLNVPAPASGITVTLSSGDTSKVTITPASVFIAANATVPATQPQVTGIAFGTVNIAAAAPGYTPSTQPVTVTTTAAFSPATLTITGYISQNLTLTLAAASPAPLTINLSSSDPTRASVPPTVTFAANTTSVTVPIQGLSAGSTIVSASAPSIVTASASVTVVPPPDIILPANLTIQPDQQVNFPVTLAKPAPAGGVFVSLSSMDPTKVTLNAANEFNVFIPEGVTVSNQPKVTGVNVGSAMITAKASGLTTASQLVQVTPGLTIAFQPPSLTFANLTTSTGNAPQNLILTLSGPAPAGGLTINLSSSDPTRATVQPTVSFSPNSVSVNVPVSPLASGTTVIHASALPNIADTAATVTIQGPPSIGVTPSMALGLGQSAAFAVTLSQAAPAGGITVTLSSGDISKVTITPASVFIAPGNTTPSVQPQITAAGAGTASITATATGYTSATGTVTVTGALTLSITPTLAINAGATGTLTLTLSGGPAPAGGLTVNLGSSDPAKASVPATVTFAAGATTATATVTGVAAGPAIITASAVGYTSATGTVTVSAALSLSITASLAINTGATGTLTLTLSGGQAPAGGLQINLASSDPAKATVPATVTFPAGATTATATVTGVAAGTAAVTASAANLNTVTSNITVTSTASQTINVPASTSMGLGLSAPFAVTLSQAAPPGGVTVTLSSSDAAKITLPATIFIAAGNTAPSAQPQVTGAGIGSAAITASATGYTSGSGAATVTAPTLSFTATTMTVAPGATGIFTLQLSGGQAPLGGLTVNLNFSDTAKATVQSTVSFAAGATSATVTVTGVAGGGTTITASAPGIAPATATLIVSGAIGVGNVSLGLGLSASFPVNLALAAPAGGVTVSLASGDPSKATVSPASVFIAAGATTPASQPQVTATGIGSALITASATGYTPGTATITVSAPTMSFSPSSLAIAAGGTGTLTLNLTGGQAPAGGLLVNLISSNTGIASVPGTVTIAAGAASVNVAVGGIAAGGPVTISATVPGIVTATSSVTVSAAPTGAFIVIPSVSIGQNLQASITISLFIHDPSTGLPVPASAPTGGLSVKLTSADASKLLVAGRQTAAGAQQVTVTIPATLSTVSGIYLQGLASSGTVTLTASAPAFTSGSSNIALTPSGFLISAPGGTPGVPSSLTTNVGTASSTLTLYSARLDSALNFVEIQQVLGGGSASAGLSNSNPAAGSAASAVIFAGGIDTVTTPFKPLGVGSATLTAIAPAGFNTPVSGNSVTANVLAATLLPASVTVGKNLETVSRVSGAASGVQITIISGDPALVQFSATPTDTGSGSIVLTVPNGQTVSPDFYVYGLGNSGSVTYTATAGGYVMGTGTVTLAPSGFVIASAGGVGQSFVAFNNNTNITVLSARLDSSLNYFESQALAGGVSASITVTSTNTNAGTISVSPVTVASGTGGALTQFQRGNSGTSNLTLTTPAGFSTPTVQSTQLTATVLSLSFSLSCDGATIGQDLQTSCTVGVGAPAPAGGLAITLTSDTPGQLLLSNTATSLGSNSISVIIPAGLTQSAPYYAQAIGGSGSVTHTASSAGFNSRKATTTLAPSGVTIAGPFGVGTLFFLSGVSTGPVPITVYTAVLNSTITQELRGGIASVDVSLSSSNPGVGTIASPVTITSGSGSAVAQFTPLSQGTTFIAVVTPAGSTATLAITLSPSAL